MNAQHDPSAQLGEYLAQFQARLRRMHLARALAAAATVALLLTLGGVWFAIQRGFADAIVYGTRIALLLSLALIALLLWLRPWRALARQPAAAVEALTPEFKGRIDTWAGLQSAEHPLKDLLAEDALAVAYQHPVDDQVRRWWLAVPAVIAVGAAGALLWLAVAGPGLYGYGVRHVWAGWAVKGLLPDQAILVTPGNEAVRRGGSVPVLATAHGFDPGTAQLFARIGEAGWQQVDMTRSKRGFEFTFLSVREPVQYYVAAGSVRSPSYRVDVVEVPNIENLKVVYDYPSWTRRKQTTDDPGGDVSGVTGTGVQLEIKTDRPIGAGTLVLNGKDAGLDVAGTSARAGFTIKEDGRYYIAARVGRETVRLSDDYLIKVTPDNKPEVKIVKPGRDWSASSIEEVAARVQASDDYALEGVQLRYAINGGEWQSVPLRATGDHVDATHMMMLEDMRVASENRPLAAGDLIAYYATARDRAQSAQTDMYFVQVRPYDRKFSESQQAGGGGGGGGGDDGGQQEISRRQKEILVSTWNLIRQKTDTSARPAAAPGNSVKDNSLLLSDVQQKLAAQAESLAARAESRELTDQDEQVKSFVNLMKDAAKSMQPASQRLAAVDLEKAIQPEQLALQYLLRAESVFNDLQLSMQRGAQGGGGGGSQTGNDLAQLYDLEMDLKKNQYENANSASPTESSQQQLNDAARKLEELARRQEQLARDAQRTQQLTDEQKWQQEALRREAEQLQQQLNNMQQQAANAQRGQQGGQAGQQGGQQGGQAGQGGAAQAARQLEQALSAMNRASEAMRNDQDPAAQRQQLQRAASEAGRQLNGASQQLTQQRADALREQLAALNAQADRAYAAQSASEQQLQGAASAAASAAAGAGRSRLDGAAGLGAEQRRQIAADKRALADSVQRMEQDLAAASRRWRSESPDSADKVGEASQLLANGQVQQQLGQSAQYIERGLAAFVVPRESGLTDTLREVRDVLRAAQSGAQGATGGQRSASALQEALSRVQSLRDQVQQLANARATGQQGQAGQSAQSGQGQQSAQGQAGQQGQSGSAGQQGASGQAGQSGPGGRGNGATVAGVQQGLGTAGRQIGGLGPVLRGQGVDPASIGAITDLARQLQGTNLGAARGDQLNRQLQSSLALLEQLEVKLARSAPGGSRGSVRTTVNEPVTDEYRDAVAEYYRQLSKN